MVKTSHRVLTTEGGDSLPGQGSKNLCAAWSGKKKKKSICLAFKPTCLLNNNIFKLSGFFFFLGNYKIILCDYVI